MSNPSRELNDLVTMFDFFMKNQKDISPVSQLQFLTAMVKFSEEIKPIYVKELIRLEGGK